MKAIRFGSLLLLIVILSCGCSLKRNVAPQAEVFKDVRKNINMTAPSDDRPGIDTPGSYVGDWKEIIFNDFGSGIPVSTLEPYEDTGVTIEVVFYFNERPADANYYVLGIVESESWDKLYEIDPDYISDVPLKKDAFDNAGKPLCYAYMQEDGFISFPVNECISSGWEYNRSSFTFRLTSQGIKYLLDDEMAHKGLGFITYGVVVTKVIVDAPSIDPQMTL